MALFDDTQLLILRIAEGNAGVTADPRRCQRAYQGPRVRNQRGRLLGARMLGTRMLGK